MKKLFAAILILIGAACAVLVWMGKGAEDIVPESVMEDLSETPAVMAIRFQPTGKTGPDVSRKTDAKARELIAGARRFLSLGDLQNVRRELEAVEGLLCSMEIKREAEALAEKVVPLYEQIFTMKPEPIEGLNVTAVDQGKKRKELMNEYLEKKDRLPEEDALAHYDLAVFCRKKGMDDLAASHLKTALEIDEDVYESIGNEGAKKLYLMTVWFGSIGENEQKKEYENKLKERYSSSKYVAMLKEEAARPDPPPPKEKIAPPPPKKKTTTPSSPLDWEAEGDKAYNTGLGHYKKSMPFLGTPQFSKENKLAIVAFDKAVKYYKKAKKEGNASPGIDTKITDANSLKYGCFKMARLH